MVNSVSYYAGSYAFNGWLYAYTPNTTLSNSLAMPTSQASYILLPKGWKPSVPLFCDSVWIETFPTSKDTYAANLQPSMTTPGMGNICINRHHRAINVVFLDGSASTTQLQDLWNLPWSTNYTPPATPVVVPLVP